MNTEGFHTLADSDRKALVEELRAQLRHGVWDEGQEMDVWVPMARGDVHLRQTWSRADVEVLVRVLGQPAAAPTDLPGADNALVLRPRARDASEQTPGGS